MIAEPTMVAEILAAEHEWAEAFRTLDIERIEQMMAADYVIIQPGGGAVGKRQTLASLQSEQRHWEIARSDQHDIRVYGDTAVVIGRWVGKGVNHGVAFDYQARYLCVWVKRAGRWQIVADQSSEIRAES